MTESWQEEFDRRQYTLVSDLLKQYESGVLELGSLLVALKSVLRILEIPDSLWMAQFQSDWLELESIYAVACDRKEQYLAPDLDTTIGLSNNQAVIKATVRNMQHLVRSRIDEQDEGPS